MKEQISPGPESESRQIEIGQKVELRKIPQDSPFIFRIPDKEGLYCLFGAGDNPTINKIFKAEDGHLEGKWVCLPVNKESAEPGIQVEIVDIDQDWEETSEE